MAKKRKSVFLFPLPDGSLSNLYNLVSLTHVKKVMLMKDFFAKITPKARAKKMDLFGLEFLLAVMR